MSISFFYDKVKSSLFICSSIITSFWLPENSWYNNYISVFLSLVMVLLITQRIYFTFGVFFAYAVTRLSSWVFAYLS